jgi:ectoine hydroxylase-related dioxygenase (phytanoyl-CoA dioxygenase family)
MERVIRDQKRADVPQPISCRNLGGDPATPVWQIVNIWKASKPFEELVHHRAIVELAAELLGGREMRLWHDQIQYKPAGIGGVNPWHQDWPYWGILDAPHQVTAWVALDDVDGENGAMSMVPGSQLWGNQIQMLGTLPSFEAMPAQFEGKEVNVRLCPVRAGQVHFHHAMTWHGSNRNGSGRKRRAIALHFMSDQTRYRAAGNHLMKPCVSVADGEVLRGAAFPLVWQATGN